MSVAFRGRRRIIPARAGFTAPCTRPRGRPRDHPRSRGVYEHMVPLQQALEGSSPLARGLLHFGLTSLGMTRIIPARAGFTPTTCPTTWASSDHPRSRGVYSVIGVLTGIVAGSSPLARGLPLGGVVDRVRDRIIPARAGFTSPPGTCGPGGTDHPRSRGVYEMNESASSSQLGSSPLARGLRSPVGDRLRSLRIIPARAGFTPDATRRTTDHGDHPRSRGVYVHPPGAGLRDRGSSPLARGLPHSRSAHRRAEGIIPARAGFTPSPRSAPPCWRDHPRSRGVYYRHRQIRPGQSVDHPRSRGVS